MSNKKLVELGDEAKDLVSGFKGIVTSITSYINGCDRCCLTSKISKDKKSEHEFFDVNQVTVLKKGVVKPTVLQKKTEKVGGPRLNERRSGI